MNFYNAIFAKFAELNLKALPYLQLRFQIIQNLKIELATHLTNAKDIEKVSRFLASYERSFNGDYSVREPGEEYQTADLVLNQKETNYVLIRLKDALDLK